MNPEEPRRVEIHLGTLCNNRCAFCMSSMNRDDHEPWAALEARDSYLDQPNGEWLRAGMEPIMLADRVPKLFYLVRRGDGGLWLDSSDGNADDEWRPVYEWLFGLPRK